MQIIANDIEVFGLLEKANRADLDPKKPAVINFIFEENWHLLLFNPEGENKGCRLFIIPENLFVAQIGNLLIPELLALDHNPGYELLIDEALDLVEQVLQAKKNDQLFFDAH